MKCDDIKTFMHDWLDGLLPETRQREFQAHLDGCPICSRDVQEMKHVLSALCKLKQPAAAPPPDFTARVMGRLREEEHVMSERRILRIPIRALAMAASMLFLLGINSIVLSSYRAGGFIGLTLPPFSDSTQPGKQVAQKTEDEPTATKPGDKGNVAAVPADMDETEPVDPSEELTENVPEEPDVEAAEGLPEAGEPALLAEAPEPQPEVTEHSAQEQPTPEAKKERKPKDKPAEQAVAVVLPPAPLPVQPRQVNINELVLPDPEVFTDKKRVTEGTMVKLNVTHLEKASQTLVSNATIKGLSPALEYTVLQNDGRLVRVYQYEVPFNEVNQFVTATASLGRLIVEERSRADISSEYAAKLAQYERLVEKSQTVSRDEAEQLSREINRLVEELSRLDRNAKNTQNVIVWLES